MGKTAETEENKETQFFNILKTRVFTYPSSYSQVAYQVFSLRHLL
jgi:hypothetical protein